MRRSRRCSSYLSAATLFALAWLLGDASARGADVAVIVNKDSNVGAIDEKLISEIYTGQTKLWRSGEPVVAYDLPEDALARGAFSATVLGKSIGNMKALAAQNLFSGKAVPPKQLSSDEEVKKAVSVHKNAIGYIRASSVDDTVKAVLTR
jgi:ABC-type phosphate transport system substrate-binding protein